jgi:UDP-N-acetylmuramoyl-tripeptide--D-alanyl-D-alanine ligase
VNFLWMLGAAVGTAAGVFRSRVALHMLQQDSYHNGRFLSWTFARPVPRWILQWKQGEAKKPLAWTGRAKRIFGVAAVVIAVSSYFLSILAAFLAPFAMVLANILLIPVQNVINQGFVRQARRKLDAIKPVVIGVAGSYGKTSTKYFTASILDEKFRTLKTPNSFNTLLGVCRVINGPLESGGLRNDHQVFVVEMGAYRRGEVAETVRLVRPRYGIITSIGPEHFERFLSIENIQATNYEVIADLPKDGAGVFNCDIPECAVLADRTKHTRVFRYGIHRQDPDHQGMDLWAEAIEHSADGMRFTMVHRDGHRQPASTSIVGRHNVQNILAAALVALDMGLTFEEIARGIAKLEPAPHRLNIIKGAGGVIVIDDSYNSNPLGAAEALNVLGEFRTGRRMLVAPGMVELGTLHEEKNREFGMQAAKVCDYIFLVGPEQTKPIAEGLQKAGYPQAQYRVCRDLKEATTAMQVMVRAGDAVLFENDLPDLYSE